MFTKSRKNLICLILATFFIIQPLTSKKANAAAAAVTIASLGTAHLPLLFAAFVGAALTGVGIANYIKDPFPNTIWEDWRWQVVLGIVILDAKSGRFEWQTITPDQAKAQLGIDNSDDVLAYNEQVVDLNAFLESTLSQANKADLRSSGNLTALQRELRDQYLAFAKPGTQKIVEALLKQEVVWEKN